MHVKIFLSYIYITRSDDDDILCGIVLSFCHRDTEYKNLIEYLFWVWDPELEHGQNKLLQTLEEGFMSADTYYVIITLICSLWQIFDDI